MASTRQLRGGNYVLSSLEEEDLDILLQGLSRIQENPPDFSTVPAEFRPAMERTYSQWKHRVDGLCELITNVTSAEEQAAAREEAKAEEKV
jgi:hypothetical protein